jgi:hypothetical protein
MSHAERNREIKKVLSAAFGAGKVRVHGSRGTASGWVTINIDYRPRNEDEARTLKAKVWELFAAAGIRIGTYGYDDPGSDYGHGHKMHLNFGRCRDAFEPGERVVWESGSKVGTVKEPNYRAPGWYMVQWDDEPAPQEFHKRDLISMEGQQL